MKRFSTLLLTLLCLLGAHAAPRTAAEAQALAAQFLHQMGRSTLALTGAPTLQLVATSADVHSQWRTTRSATTPAYYVYNQAGQGYVIVSGEDTMDPILAHSHEGCFDLERIPDNMREWLKLYVLKAEEASHATTSTTLPQTMKGQVTSVTSSAYAPEVAPLLGEIKYGQNAPYNDLCPTYQGEKSVTGCVATAMAQLMRYHQYPTQPTGNVSYTTKTLGLDVNVNLDYFYFDWDQILPDYSLYRDDPHAYTPLQYRSVAELMLACGASAQMDYTPYGSGASDYMAFRALIENFGFNPFAFIADREYHNSEEWMSIIKKELNAKRPIYYSGNSWTNSGWGGHAFVVDGYDANDMVHVNWGWEGMSNGYFRIITLDPKNQGTGGANGTGYEFRQHMICNLSPEKSVPCTYYRADYLEVNAETKVVNVHQLLNCAYTSTSEIALIAEKNNQQYVISNTELIKVPTYEGYSSLQFNLIIPDTLEAGTYEIQLATRIVNTQHWDYVNIHTEFTPTYQLVVAADHSYTIITDTDSFIAPITTITPKGELHANRTAHFTFEVTNPRVNHELFSTMGLAMLSPTGGQLVNTLIKNVNLQPGETRNIDFSYKMPKYTGPATLYVTWEYANKMGESLDVEVLEEGIQAGSLIVSNPRLLSESVPEDSQFVWEAEVSIDNVFDYVETNLVSYMGDRQGNTYYNGNIVPVMLKRGEKKTYRGYLPIRVTPGPYMFSLWTYNPEQVDQQNQFTNYWFKEITITKKAPTAINEATNHETAVQLRINNEQLTLSSEQGIAAVRIYGINGIRYVNQQWNEAAQTRQLSVATLAAGNYIVQVSLNDGTVQTLKLLK